MDMLTFTESAPLSMGVELELQIVNRRDYNLTRGAADIMHLVERQPPVGEIKPEITEGMIEISTTVHHDVEVMLAELYQIRAHLLACADKHNLALAGGGTHAFQRWSEQRIYPQERYQLVSELYGYLAKQFTVFGQHIHIGCRNGDEACRLVHLFAAVMPHFIALSASSPFYQGVDTAFCSSRLNCVNAFPLSGSMPFVLTWDAFNAYFAQMREYGIVQSMKDFYWDIRPKPEFGTIEIRVCDTPLTLEHAVLLAAYARTLAHYFMQHPELTPDPDVYLTYAYNRFQACRFGLEGSVVNVKVGEPLPLYEAIAQMLDRLMPYAAEVGTTEALCALALHVANRHSDAQWLREQLQQTGSINHVVKLASERWMANG